MPEAQMSPMAQMQGQLWSARAQDWADIQEGAEGWGIPLYAKILDEAGVADGTRVLDVGCGSGRFARLAADRKAQVAGIDPAPALLEIARQRTPEGDFRVGDMQSIPFEDDSFEITTAFSSLQFAADPVLALTEMARVTESGCGIAVAIPGSPENSELTPIMGALRPLFPPPPPGTEPPDPMALSRPGVLEARFEEARLKIEGSGAVDCPIDFADEDTFVRGILAAGPAALAVQHSGGDVVTDAVLEAAAPFRNAYGGYRLENEFRYVLSGT